MKLSARNVSKRRLADVRTGPISARVLVDISAGNVANSVITADAVNDLEPAEGVGVPVGIKSPRGCSLAERGTAG